MELQPGLWMVHGPTASGKTALAIELAQHLGTEIVNCDARQVYRELNVGVARPSEAELAAVPHHGIASHSIHEPLTAASYAAWAEPVVQRLLDRHGSAVVVGGSGLYAAALLDGLDEMPSGDPELRARFEAQWQLDSRPLVDELRDRDPDYAASADLKNPRRVVRALEVLYATGRPYSEFRQQQPTKSWNAAVHEIKIQPELRWLEPRIAARAREMLRHGLRDEALALKPWADTTPLQTVGYREFYAPEAPLNDDDAMADLVALHTRQYAKRQLTWLAKRTAARAIPAEGAWTYLRTHGRP
ncbi:MAG: tRNA (adenosine(37)-N6)-dimethylallyltransferase MiaA [Schleiferiaceae bacterium]